MSAKPTSIKCIDCGKRDRVEWRDGVAALPTGWKRVGQSGVHWVILCPRCHGAMIEAAKTGRPIGG